MIGALKQIIPQTPASIGHHKSESLTGVMMFLYCSMVWLAVSVDGAESLFTVSAPVGSTAVLPCKLTKEFTSKSVIKWDVGHDKLVLERSINDMIEGSGFEGRVDVPVAELLKGNCSLVLKDVRISDEDLYQSFSVELLEESEMTLISRVHLSVSALQISAPEGSTVLLPCKWSHLSVQTSHVDWRNHREMIVFERKSKDSSQGKGYEGRVDVPEDELLKGNCSLVLKNVSVSDAGIYRSSMLVEEIRKHVLVQKIELSVNKRSEEKTDPSEHWDKPEPVGDGNIWIIWIGFISVLVSSIIIIIVFVKCRRRKWNFNRTVSLLSGHRSTDKESQIQMREISTQKRKHYIIGFRQARPAKS